MSSDDTTERNKAVVLKYINDLMSQGKYEILEEIFAPDFVSHAATGRSAAVAGEDLAGRAAAIRGVRAAFPDWHLELKHLIAEGDFVVDYVTITGTHLGEQDGTPPSGQKVTGDAVHIWRLRDGKIVEGWHITSLPQPLVPALRPSHSGPEG